MKIFSKDEYGNRFLLEWERGYVRFENDWAQLRNWRSFNWLNARPLVVEAEFSHYFLHSVELTVVVLGLGIFLNHVSWVDEELKCLVDAKPWRDLVGDDDPSKR